MLTTDMASLSKTLSHLLIPCLALACPLAAQDLEADLTSEIIAKRAELLSARFDDLQAIKVNGVQIDPILMKRELIHLVGSKHVEAKISEFFLQEQLDAAIKSGRDPSEFEVTEAEVMKDLSGLIAEARKQSPGIKFWDAIRSVYGMEKEAFMEQNRQSKLFDKIFFPGPAKNWPQITQEAIQSQSNPGQSGSVFWQSLMAQTGDRAMPPFLLGVCRQWVLAQLREWSDVIYPSYGLPPEVCLRVNDKDWLTEDAFALIKPSVFPQDLERAIKEVIIGEILRQELMAKDSYLSDEEFKTGFDEYSAQFDGSAFPLDQIVMTYKGYPGTEPYRRRWRLIQSYAKMVDATITDRVLSQYGKKYVRFFRNSPTDIDLIPFFALDLDSGAWIPGGIERARQRADAAMQEIEAGADFVELLESRGEFFKSDEARGRLGGEGYNKLRQVVFESEYTDLLQGSSMASFLYFDADVGKVYGPLKGPKAWYLARVNSRVPVQGTPDLSQPNQRKLVKQDYIVHSFQQWASEIIARARVE